MSKKIWIVVALLAIGSGGYSLWRMRREPALPPASTDKGVVRNADPADRDGSDASTQAASSVTAKAGTKTSSLRQRFEQSRDLFALVQEAKAAADGGDPTAKTVIADAMYECIDVILPPNSRHGGVYLVEKQHPELKGYVDALLAVDQARCGRFTKSDIGSLNAVLDEYASAAKAGSAKAMAMHLTYSNLAAIPDQELAGDIQTIVSSGDPDAIGALSNLMGLRAEDRASVFGSQSGSAMHQYAWQLAACQMGMNCGPGSALLRGYCLNGGMCGATSIDQVISTFLTSPAEYRTAVAESQQIVKSLSVNH